MRNKRCLSISILTVLFAALWSNPPAAAQVDVGTAFTYQGNLELLGSPVNDSCGFEFSLWDDETDAAPAAQVGSTLSQSIDVTDGVFDADLDFGSGSFIGQARWLEISVCCPPDDCLTPPTNYTTLTPRQELTPAPHALALPGLYTEQNAESPNIIGGYEGNSVTPGTVGATIGGGGNNEAGWENQVFADYATVGGGLGNAAFGHSSIVGGGGFNTASGPASAVGGGLLNAASGMWSTVGGGATNTASGEYAAIGGGRSNVVSADYSTISGGGESIPGISTTANFVCDDYGTVSGGGRNKAGSDDADSTNDRFATVGGGENNTASGGLSTVGGGATETRRAEIHPPSVGDSRIRPAHFLPSVGVMTTLQTVVHLPSAAEITTSPADYIPPSGGGQTTLPAELGQLSVGVKQTSRALTGLPSVGAAVTPLAETYPP